MFEIGDQPDDVGKRRQRSERRAALEVDEEQVEAIGCVAQRERGEDRLQQLALAGAGRPGDHSVRTVPAQPDRHWRARVVGPDGDGQPLAGGLAPTAEHVGVGCRAETEQLDET